MSSILAFDQKASMTEPFSLTDQFYDCFVCDESQCFLVYTKLLVKSFILALGQTAYQTNHFSVTGQFYDSFVSDESTDILVIAILLVMRFVNI